MRGEHTLQTSEYLQRRQHVRTFRRHHNIQHRYPHSGQVRSGLPSHRQTPADPEQANRDFGECPKTSGHPNTPSCTCGNVTSSPIPTHSVPARPTPRSFSSGSTCTLHPHTHTHTHKQAAQHRIPTAAERGERERAREGTRGREKDRNRGAKSRASPAATLLPKSTPSPPPPPL